MLSGQGDACRTFGACQGLLQGSPNGCNPEPKATMGPSLGRDFDSHQTFLNCTAAEFRTPTLRPLKIRDSDESPRITSCRAIVWSGGMLGKARRLADVLNRSSPINLLRSWILLRCGGGGGYFQPPPCDLYWHHLPSVLADPPTSKDGGDRQREHKFWYDDDETSYKVSRLWTKMHKLYLGG